MDMIVGKGEKKPEGKKKKTVESRNDGSGDLPCPASNHADLNTL